jgi:hypothetical protein
MAAFPQLCVALPVRDVTGARCPDGAPNGALMRDSIRTGAIGTATSSGPGASMVTVSHAGGRPACGGWSRQERSVEAQAARQPRCRPGSRFRWRDRLSTRASAARAGIQTTRPASRSVDGASLLPVSSSVSLRKRAMSGVVLSSRCGGVSHRVWAARVVRGAVPRACVAAAQAHVTRSVVPG